MTWSLRVKILLVLWVPGLKGIWWDLGSGLAWQELGLQQLFSESGTHPLFSSFPQQCNKYYFSSNYKGNTYSLWEIWNLEKQTETLKLTLAFLLSHNHY